MSRRDLIQSGATGVAGDPAVVQGWEVLRDGRIVRPVSVSPTLSSDPLLWDGLVLESYDLPPCDIPDHEHPTHYLSLQTSGPIRAEWSMRGETRTGVTGPGTIEVIPRGGRDRVVWLERSSRLVVMLHPRFLIRALEETAHLADVELAQQMDLHDRHIASLILALRADLEDGSPAGRLYGESVGTALAVYLQRRYAARPVRPAQTRGGLPTYRLRRVQEYIAAHLDQDLRLADLASAAGMSPHYFAELFRRSTGISPHQYVLTQRIERAKQLLRDRAQSVLDAALLTGFEDQSHFTKVFRRMVGTTPARYRAEL